MTPALQAGLAFVALFLYANLLEYVVHRWVMHRGPSGRARAGNPHLRFHHATFRAGRAYHVQRDADRRHVLLFTWWQGWLWVAAHVPVLAGAERLTGATLLWPGVTALTGYWLLYEYLHWCMHTPAGRRLETTGIFRYLDGRHRLHHRHWRVNFNVFLPLGDLVFGTDRAPAAGSSRDAAAAPLVR